MSFYNACKTGDLKLVQLMIQQGANNWNNGLYGACSGGHLEIVQFGVII